MVVPVCRTCVPSSLTDQERIEVLKATGLVDTLPEPALDRITSLVRTVLDVPVALISLVDDRRQFFKSQQGLPEPWASRRETPLSHSYCQHVVTTAEPLVVTDARTDKRVQDNLALRDLNVVAYAGYPIVAPNGVVLGSLCAIKGEAHQWTENQLIALRELSDAVSNEVALRLEIKAHTEALEEVARKQTQAEEANEAKTLFLRRVSHELRTPLNAIIGFSEVLSDETFGDLNSKQHKYVGNVLHCSRHLLSLIDTLLDLSAVEENQLKLELRLSNLENVLESVCSQLETIASKKDLTFSFPQGNGSVNFEFDENRLRQVIMNLVGNAIKFTPEKGKIEVTCHSEEDRVLVKVSDTGIGLSPSDMEQLFDPFYRSPEVLSLQGTGLGLAIAKAIVELHGGALEAQSSGPGKGSTFILSFPLKATSPDPETATQS